MKKRTSLKSVKAAPTKSRRIEGFEVLENECIWMKAGVINYRLCDHAYDCNNCPFDTGMRKAMGMDDNDDSKKIAPRWVRYLQERYHGSSRPCRHVLTGRVEAPKLCTLNYECHHCTFDQLLDDMDESEVPGVPVTIWFRVSGWPTVITTTLATTGCDSNTVDECASDSTILPCGCSACPRQLTCRLSVKRFSSMRSVGPSDGSATMPRFSRRLLGPFWPSTIE